MGKDPATKASLIHMERSFAQTYGKVLHYSLHKILPAIAFTALIPLRLVTACFRLLFNILKLQTIIFQFFLKTNFKQTDCKTKNIHTKVFIVFRNS